MILGYFTNKPLRLDPRFLGRFSGFICVAAKISAQTEMMSHPTCEMRGEVTRIPAWPARLNGNQTPNVFKIKQQNRGFDSKATEIFIHLFSHEYFNLPREHKLTHCRCCGMPLSISLFAVLHCSYFVASSSISHPRWAPTNRGHFQS